MGYNIKKYILFNSLAAWGLAVVSNARNFEAHVYNLYLPIKCPRMNATVLH